MLIDKKLSGRSNCDKHLKENKKLKYILKGYIFNKYFGF